MGDVPITCVQLFIMDLQDGKVRSKDKTYICIWWVSVWWKTKMGEYVWMCDRVYCLLSSCLAHTQPKALRVFFVYYESIKREPKIRGINKCRCDERLCVVVYCKSKARAKDYTRLPTCFTASYFTVHKPEQPYIQCVSSKRLPFHCVSSRKYIGSYRKYLLSKEINWFVRYDC
jgi:hypothetical protein